jgi:hypothetical protein
MANQMLHAEKWPTTEESFLQVMSQVGVGYSLDGAYTGKYIFENGRAKRGNTQYMEGYLSAKENLLAELQITHNDDGTISVRGKINAATLNAENMIPGLISDSKFLPLQKTITIPAQSFALNNMKTINEMSHPYDAVLMNLQLTLRPKKGGKIMTVQTPVSLTITPQSYVISQEGTVCVRVELNTHNELQQDGNKPPNLFIVGAMAGYYCRAQ